MTNMKENMRSSSRSTLISTIVAALVVLYLFYLVHGRYGYTGPKLGWAFLFALLALGISILKGASNEEARSMEPLGLLTLRTLYFTLVVVFLLLIPDAQTFIDSVASETWPIFAGAGLGWLLSSSLSLVRKPRN